METPKPKNILTEEQSATENTISTINKTLRTNSTIYTQSLTQAAEEDASYIPESAGKIYELKSWEEMLRQGNLPRSTQLLIKYYPPEALSRKLTKKEIEQMVQSLNQELIKDNIHIIVTAPNQLISKEDLSKRGILRENVQLSDYSFASVVSESPSEILKIEGVDYKLQYENSTRLVLLNKTKLEEDPQACTISLAHELEHITEFNNGMKVTITDESQTLHVATEAKSSFAAIAMGNWIYQNGATTRSTRNYMAENAAIYNWVMFGTVLGEPTT